MKKLFALLLSALMLLSMSACGGEPEQTNSEATTASTGSTEATTAASAPETQPVTVPETQDTASTTAPETTEPVSTEPATTEPTPTEPEYEEDPEEKPAELTFSGSYFKKSGAPTLGTANGNTYTNDSIGLNITLNGEDRFASEASMLETNEVSTTEGLVGKEYIYITANFRETVIVEAYQLGSSYAGSMTGAESAFLHVVKKAAAKQEATGAEVTLEARTEQFSAGGARAVVVRVTKGHETTNYLYIGYQVGEYVVVVMVNDFYGDPLETMLAGVKIK